MWPNVCVVDLFVFLCVVDVWQRLLRMGSVLFVLLVLVLSVGFIYASEPGLSVSVGSNGDEKMSPELKAFAEKLNKGLLACQNMKKSLEVEFMVHNHTDLFNGLIMPPTSMDVFVAKHFKRILEGGKFKYVFHGTSVCVLLSVLVVCLWMVAA